MALPALRPLAFGEVLDQAFALYRRCFMPLVVISLVCSGLPTLLNLTLTATGQTAFTTEGFETSALLLFSVVLVLSIVGGALANGASTFVVSEQYLGRSLEAREALGRAWPRMGTILVTTITVGLLTGLGFLLLIVPGVIAFTGFSLAVTAATLEGLDSGEARSRSWQLTKDFRGQIFSLMFVYGVIVWIITAGVGVVSAVLIGMTSSGDPAAIADAATSFPVILFTAISAFLTLLINPLLYCILIVAYYDLRVRKEAFDLDLLASTLEHTAVPR